MSALRHSFGEREQTKPRVLDRRCTRGRSRRARRHHVPGDNPRRCPRCRPARRPITWRARRLARRRAPLQEVRAESGLDDRELADGDRLETGSLIGRLAGPMRSLLAIERTALNFLQRLSGIAILDRALRRRGPRHARHHLRHAQDNSGLAFSREIRSPLRRRIQSPIRPL